MSANFHMVLFPVLLSAFLVAAMSPVQRVALVGKKSTAVYLAVSYTIATLGFVLLYLYWWGLTWPQNLKDGFWHAAFAAGAINVGIQYMHAKSLTYKAGEVSLVILLSAMTPGLITLLAITLGEIPGWAGWLGIMFMVAGSWVILTKEKPAHWWGYLRPFSTLSLLWRYSSLNEKERDRAKVVGLALGSAVLSTFGLLVVGLYARRAGDLQGIWTAITINWAVVGAAFAMLNLRRPRELISEWRGKGGTLLLLAGAYALLLVGANYLEVPAFAETYVAYVGTLNRSRILFGIVIVWVLYKLGFKLFGEEDLKKRLVAAMIIIIGVALIASEGLPAKLTDKLILFGF